MFKDILSQVIWSFIVIFAVPSLLIIVSWNAVPGDITYGVKTGLEKTMFYIAGITPWQGDLQIKYTERRLTEMEKVITTVNAEAGIDNFNNQIIATKTTISQIKNPEEKHRQVESFIKTLENASQKIDEVSQNTQTTTISPTTIPKKSVSPTIIPVIAHPTTFPEITTPPNTTIGGKLIATKETIDQIIVDLTPEADTSAPTPTSTLIPSPTPQEQHRNNEKNSRPQDEEEKKHDQKPEEENNDHRQKQKQN